MTSHPPRLRGWVGWVAAHRARAGLLAVACSTCLVGLVLVATDGSDDRPANPGGRGEVAADMGPAAAPATSTPLGSRGSGSSPPTGATPGGQPAPATPAAAARGRPPVIPGTPAPPRCTPREDYRATGIDKGEVRIGQIISDVSVIPAQFQPAHEGLQAYLNLVNDAGGVCGRKIRIEYSNDNANPATHDYEGMARRVFAFVANASLIEQQDYEEDAPFNPRYKDGDEYVPDVGGLALTYPRAQSPWHAGVVGSLSPSLLGPHYIRYLVEEARSGAAGAGPCVKAGFVSLREPSGVSRDQARLAGAVAAAEWGGGFGDDNVEYYVANLGDPTPVWEQIVTRMAADGVNCAFTYMDVASDINFVRAAVNRGMWPPDQCNTPPCFSVVSITFAGYGSKFVRDAGDGASAVTTFIPHPPLVESGNRAMAVYLQALKGVANAEPSSFSLLGFGSGEMFVQALQACGAAPTRGCVMNHLRGLGNFTAGGLLGPTTPFRATRVRCDGDCGSFRGRGVYNWRWVFNCLVYVRVLDRDGRRDFHRVHPGQAYACDELRVARGTPA